jgi:hypothetical protein
VPRIILHIHEEYGDPCIACGTTQTEVNENAVEELFMTEVTEWNQKNARCRPTGIVSLAFVLTGRADYRTSALKEERIPNRRRVRDRR